MPMPNQLLSSQQESNAADYRPWIIFALLAVLLFVGFIAYLQ